MSKFAEFFDHEEDDISKIAIQLSDLEGMLDNGDLTKDEFKELADDLLEYDQIDKLAGSIERQVQYKKAFDALVNIVDVITIF